MLAVCPLPHQEAEEDGVDGGVEDGHEELRHHHAQHRGEQSEQKTRRSHAAPRKCSRHHTPICVDTVVCCHGPGPYPSPMQQSLRKADRVQRAKFPDMSRRPGRYAQRAGTAIAHDDAAQDDAVLHSDSASALLGYDAASDEGMDTWRDGAISFILAALGRPAGA